MKNLFITFEGIDGSGKDTQIMNLASKIRDESGYPFGDKYTNIWITREATNITEYGRKLLDIFKSGKINPQEIAKLFIKDRLEHTKIIKDILKHSTVICSRYDISTLAYQNMQGIDLDYLYDLHNYGSEAGALVPDITIYFKLDVQTALDRINKRGSEKEYFEKEELMKKALDYHDKIISYLKKKQPNRRFIILDATKTIEEIEIEMYKKINEIVLNF
jgi:dTMP kinase